MAANDKERNIHYCILMDDYKVLDRFELNDECSVEYIKQSLYHDKVHCFVLLFESGLKCLVNPECYAAAHGSIKCIEYIQSKRPLDDTALFAALANGYLECARKLIPNGASEMQKIHMCEYAAKSGDPEIFDFALANGGLVSDKTFNSAFNHYNPEILKKISNYSFLISENTILNAIKAEEAYSIHWIMFNLKNKISTNMLNELLKNDNIHIDQSLFYWYIYNENFHELKLLMEMAAKYNNQNALKQINNLLIIYSKANGKAGDKPDAESDDLLFNDNLCLIAAKHGHADLLEFLYHRGVFSLKAYRYSKWNRHTDCTDFLVDIYNGEAKNYTNSIMWFLHILGLFCLVYITLFKFESPLV